MKELLIKIRALFEGNGADQAASSLNKVSDAADKAKSSTGNLSGGLGDGAAKAGIFGGAMAAVTGAVIGFAEQALSAAINALKNLAVGFAEGILKVGQLADDLDELSARTGVATGDLLVLRKAFEDAGIGADAVGPMMNRLQKALAGVNEEGQPTSAALAKLGLSVASLRTMSGVQQIAAVQDAIMKLPGPAAQAAAAMEIFGRSGGQMLALFKDSGALDAAREKLGSLVENMVKAGPAMAKFGEAFSEDNINTKKMQFFTAAAVQFSAELEKAGVILNQLDLGPLGAQVGYVVRGTIEIAKAFKEVADAIGLSTNSLTEFLETYIRIVDFTGLSKIGFFLRDVGKAAVEAENDVAATNKALADEAHQRALSFIESARAASQGITQQQIEAGVKAVDVAGLAAERQIDFAGNQGAEKLQLTAQQIEQAAQQLATAFQTGMGQNISPALQALVNAVQTNMTQLGASIAEASQQLTTSLNSETIVQPLQTMSQTLATFNQTLSTQLNALNTSMSGLSSVSQQMSTTAATMQQQLATLQAGVNSLASSMQADSVAKLGQQLAQLGPALSQVFQSIGQANHDVLQAVSEGSKQTFSSIKAGISAVESAMSAQMSGVGAAMNSLGSTIGSAISRLEAMIYAVAARIR